MKPNLYPYYLILLVLFLTNCKKNDLKSEKHLNDFQILLKQGFDTSGIKDVGNYYAIEGDILIPKELLTKTIRRQALATPNIPISLSNQSDITIYLDPNIHTGSSSFNWRPALEAAITEYHNIQESYIRFRVVNTLPADIIMRPGTASELGTYWGTGALPLNNGKPGNLLTYANSLSSGFNLNQKKYFLIHELGHCLGLRHTNWYFNTDNESENFYDNGISYGAYRIGASSNSPLETQDVSSIFNWNLQNPPTVSTFFSAWDKYAINYLYPLPFKINGNFTSCNQGDYVVQNLIHGASVVNWSVSSNAFLTNINGAGVTVNRYNGQVGDVLLTAVIQHPSGTSYSISKTIPLPEAGVPSFIPISPTSSSCIRMNSYATFTAPNIDQQLSVAELEWKIFDNSTYPAQEITSYQTFNTRVVKSSIQFAIPQKSNSYYITVICRAKDNCGVWSNSWGVGNNYIVKASCP